MGRGRSRFLVIASLVLAAALLVPGAALAAGTLTPRQESLFRSGAATVGGLSPSEVDWVVEHPEHAAGIPVTVEHRTALSRAAQSGPSGAGGRADAPAAAGRRAVAGATAWDITYAKDVYGQLIYEFVVQNYFEYNRSTKKVTSVAGPVVRVDTGPGVRYMGISAQGNAWRTHNGVVKGLYYRSRTGHFTYLATPWGTLKHYYPWVELYMPYTGYWWSAAGR